MGKAKKLKKPISEAHRIQLENARLVLAAAGKSPRQLGEESRQKILNFIYRFGFTSSRIIQLMLGRTSGGYAKKLVKQDWIVETKTRSGVPAYYLTLSEQGLQEAERLSEIHYRYPEIDPFRVKQQLIRHDLIAQEATVNALNAGTITSYETERMFMLDGDKSGEKRPDVIWTTPIDSKMALEIELTGKWGRDLDQFVLRISKALQASQDNPAKYDRFSINSDSAAILKRYKSAFKPGAPLAIWEKNTRNHWVIEKTIEVPDWLTQKVDFLLIGKTEKHENE